MKSKAQDDIKDLLKAYSAGGLIHTQSGDYVFEQIRSPNILHLYAYALLKGHKIELGRLDFLSQDGKILTPLTDPVWIPPREPQDYSSIEELYSNLKLYVEQRSDIQDERFYDVIASWIWASWIWENFQTFPYLFAYGVKGTGKSTLLEAIEKVCYRGALSPSASTAAIFRMCQDWHVSLLLDESRKKWSEDEDLIAILNSRYRRGSRVFRVGHDEDGNQIIESYKVFGPTAIAGKRIPDDTLDSRCIRIPMERNIRDIILVADDERAGL